MISYYKIHSSTSDLDFSSRNWTDHSFCIWYGHIAMWYYTYIGNSNFFWKFCSVSQQAHLEEFVMIWKLSALCRFPRLFHLFFCIEYKRYLLNWCSICNYRSWRPFLHRFKLVVSLQDNSNFSIFYIYFFTNEQFPNHYSLLSLSWIFFFWSYFDFHNHLQIHSDCLHFPIKNHFNKCNNHQIRWI